MPVACKEGNDYNNDALCLRIVELLKSANQPAFLQYQV